MIGESIMTEILIVDDDDQIRYMLRLLFEAEGFAVREAENGKLALERYRQRAADVVILDILMPDMEGIETIRELKNINAGVNVIALSGGGRLSGEYYLKMIKGFSPRYTFTKPVDPEVLLEAVRNIMSTDEPEDGLHS